MCRELLPYIMSYGKWFYFILCSLIVLSVIGLLGIGKLAHGEPLQGNFQSQK